MNVRNTKEHNVQPNEQLSPIQILPEEIWQEIFDRVKKPKDWLNLYRVSSSFKNMVGAGNKITALFPEVLPHISKYLSRKDILNCRIISKSFKTTIENFHQESLQALNIWSHEANQYPKTGRRHEFSSLEKINKFLTFMENHPGSPFVGGHVKITLIQHTPNDRELEAEFIAVKNLLTTFGRHIQWLTIRVKFYHGSFETGALHRLRTCLELVPNVEMLEILYEGERSSPRHIFFYFEDNPLPKLHKLERFSIVDSTENISIIKLLDMCIDPEKIRDLSIPYIWKDKSNLFPNLEKLSIALTPRIQYYFIHFRWNLTSLTLNNSSCKFGNTCAMINRYFCSLVDLQLDYNIQVDWLDDFNVKLNLHELKRLKIAQVSGSMDFISRLKSLEELVVDRIDELWSTKEFQLFHEEAAMGRSNIWNAFPKLKSFRCRCLYNNILSRDMYEYNCRMSEPKKSRGRCTCQ